MANETEYEEIIVTQRTRPGYERERARISASRSREGPGVKRVETRIRTARTRWGRLSETERAKARERAMGKSEFLTWVRVRPPGSPRLDRHGHPILVGPLPRGWRTRPPGR